MNHPVGNLIFDFDGTLADTSRLIVATMQDAIGKLRLPARSEAECRATIGLRLEEIPAVLWPGISDLSVEYARCYRRCFEELKSRISIDCFPGVAGTLDRLWSAGYRMAVASSRSHKSLAEYSVWFGFEKYFCMLVGGDDVALGKPSPEPVVTILKACGWSPEETLVIGDAAVDIRMGRAAACRTCGVTYGNGTVAELREAGADMIIDSFEDIEGVS